MNCDDVMSLFWFDLIVNQHTEYIENAQALHDVKASIAKDHNQQYEEMKKEVLNKMTESRRLMLELAAEKDASSHVIQCILDDNRLDPEHQ